jgi:hypothetical protein
MKTFAHGLIVVCVFLGPLHAVAQSPPKFPGPASSEMIEIDGARNPELIPQWAAWEFAFRVLAGGSRALPPTVHHVVSKEEAALVVGEAVESQKRDAACQERMLKLRPLLLTAKAAEINRRQADIQIGCRWQTLHARDRLLERLNPEARIALSAFVESTKAGTRVTIAKRELAHYQQPQ